MRGEWAAIAHGGRDGGEAVAAVGGEDAVAFLGLASDATEPAFVAEGRHRAGGSDSRAKESWSITTNDFNYEVVARVGTY